MYMDTRRASERMLAMPTKGSGRLLPSLLQITCIMIMMIMMTMMMTAASAYAEDEIKTSDERASVTVEVVEEIPAADIEEQPVPLAAGVSAEDSSRTRHVIMMGAVLAATLAYAWYFSRYEKRLVQLRLRAAEAESRAIEHMRNSRAV